MTTIPANRNDPRRRYMHQAFYVSTLGSALETGPAGYGQRLSATNNSSIAFQVDMGVTTPQVIGTLTRGIFITDVINNLAVSGGTIALHVLNADGTGHATLIAALDGTILGPPDVALNFAPLWAPLPSDKMLSATVTGGTSGEFGKLSLLVTPFENAWF